MPDAFSIASFMYNLLKGNGMVFYFSRVVIFSSWLSFGNVFEQLSACQELEAYTLPFYGKMDNGGFAQKGRAPCEGNVPFL